MFSWVRGAHSFKFGGELRRFRNNQSTHQRLPVSPAMRVTASDGFVQDDWPVMPRLTLNVGVRYEYNGIPSEKCDRLTVYDFSSGKIAQGVLPCKKDFNKFGPRIGFSFDPFGHGKTVLGANSDCTFVPVQREMSERSPLVSIPHYGRGIYVALGEQPRWNERNDGRGHNEHVLTN